MKKIIAILFILSSPASAQWPTPPVIAPSKTSALDMLKFDFAGDSRTARLNVGSIAGNGLNAVHWFNNMNSLNSNRYILGLNLAIEGCRSDQWSQPSVINPALNSNAGWLVIGQPGYNDLSPLTGTSAPPAGGSGISCTNVSGVFPYVNNNGVTVTQSNVGAIIAANVINLANQAITKGKRIILLEESGGSLLSTASVTQLYDLNARLRAYAAATPSVYLASLNPTIWSPLASSTQVTINTNYSSDTIHPNPLGGYVSGVAMQTFLASTFPSYDSLMASISNNNVTNPRQLIFNPLFQTTSGGGNTTCTLTGNVPSLWNMNCNVGTTAVTITYPAEPNGFGNCVQMAITTAGADTVSMTSTPPSGWNLTDFLSYRVEAIVSAGSSHLNINNVVEISTDVANSFFYGLQGLGAGDGPTTAYTMQLQANGAPAPGSVVKNFSFAQNVMNFSAAGSATVQWCRATFDRIYIFNPATQTFAGQ